MTMGKRKPVEELDAFERQLQEEIKRVATRFNAINKELEKFKAWVLSTQEAIEIVNYNCSRGRKSLSDLRAIVQKRMAEAKEKISLIEKYLSVIEEEVKNIGGVIQNSRNLIDERLFSQLYARYGTLFTELEEGNERIKNRAKTDVEILQVIERGILSQSDPSAREEIIKRGFYEFHSNLKSLKRVLQQSYRQVLFFHKTQFKVYRTMKNFFRNVQ